MTEPFRYVLEPLREGADVTLYRGRQLGNPSPILAVAPAAEQPSPQGLRRLEHEYSLAAELDAAWAAKPLALTRHEGRTILLLKDPGGEPLDSVLERDKGQPLELTRVLRIAIGLASALGQVHHFAMDYAARMNKRITAISEEFMAALAHHPWPGNVRELQNLIERSVILSNGAVLSGSLPEVTGTSKLSAAVTLEQAERSHILQTLQQMKGVIGGRNGAAARLGLPRTTLIAKMRRLGINGAQSSSAQARAAAPVPIPEDPLFSDPSAECEISRTP
jgi:hypothetical protein